MLVLAGWLTAAMPAVAADDDGFISMFDGKSLDGWDGNPKFWSVQDGVITGQTTAENPTPGNTFLIWRKGKVADFELLVDFRIEGGNSGIQYRSKDLGDWVVGGYQADIDSTNVYTGITYEERGRGILAKRSEKVEIGTDGKPKVVGHTMEDAEIVSAIKNGEWNTYRIVVQGNHLQQFINGKQTVDVVDNDEVEEGPKKIGRANEGIIALQLHAGPPMKIQFRDLKVKHLSGANDQGASAGEKKGKRVVFVAGRPSHGYGQHEHNAGCILLAKHLQLAKPDWQIDVQQNGWPKNPEQFFAGADSVVMYCDGGGGHMVLPHLEEFDKLMKKGVGVVCLHYAVEVPKEKGGAEFLDWMGGYFEMFWSVNPHWTAKFESFPDHPISRGVEPFEINDEWYFHMRFRDEMRGVTPILSAIAPEATMSRPDGPHSGNPDVRRAVAAGEPQHVAWAAERDNGGRGFGFTGGHFHWNWGDENFRKLVLNAIVWTAQGEVPENGVDVKSVSRTDLEENQDEPKP
jgi:hypothetical protein